MYVPKACGFVLVREGAAGWEYLLLVNRKRGEPGLPKGHVEPGESELDTARRETAEETGLTDLDPDAWFARTLRYPAERKGRIWDKTVVYRLARLRGGEVRLSPEHTEYRWAPIDDALGALPHENLRGVVRDAALYLKDAGLFHAPSDTLGWRQLEATGCKDDRLFDHLRGGAHLARVFAGALEDEGVRVDPAAASLGAILHDVGRALGRHDDHQVAGLRHLRRDPVLAPYGFACISHFTKGATDEELLAAGLESAHVTAFHELIDMTTLTWEERCVALADACMKGPDPVPPAERFADLRNRYDAAALIDLQERRTAAIRGEMTEVLGRDPLGLVDLAG